MLKFEHTFKAGYYFDCDNCGACCRYTGGISLTRREHDAFSKTLDSEQFAKVGHAAFPYLLSNREGCRYLKDGRCVIHGNHPLFCRIYPLSLGTYSDTVFVNLIHCEGVDTSPKGQQVDSRFVKQLLAEMERMEGKRFLSEYLAEERRLVSGPLKLFADGTFTDFRSKRSILLAIVGWLSNPGLVGMNGACNMLQATIIGPFTDLRNEVLKSVGGPSRDTHLGAGRARASRVSAAVSGSSRTLESSLARGRRSVTESLTNVTSLRSFDSETGKTEVFGPEDDLTLLDYDDAPVSLKVRMALEPVIMTDEAIEMETQYVKEVLGRVGMGGIPYYLSLDEALDKLCMTVRQLEMYARYMRRRDGRDSIDALLMRDSIRNTDTHIMDLLL